MRIIIWNSQGIGKGETLRVLKDSNAEYSPLAIYLFEIKSKKRRIIKMSRRLGFVNWYVVNPVRTNAGGIMVLWLNGIQFD